MSHDQYDNNPMLIYLMTKLVLKCMLLKQTITILNQPEHVLHSLLPPPMPPNTIFVTDHTIGYFVNALPD